MYRDDGITPERTLAQRMEALHNANEIRSKRAKLKRDLKAGKTTPAEVIANPPEWLLNAKAYDVILATPKFGRVKTNRLFQQCRISPSKTIGGMTDRQRDELRGHLPGVRA